MGSVSAQPSRKLMTLGLRNVSALVRKNWASSASSGATSGGTMATVGISQASKLPRRLCAAAIMRARASSTSM